ncbi:hypothetical protein [Comamonas sp. JC664]
MQLSRDVAAQQSNLNWLVAVLILCVAMAGIYMHARSRAPGGAAPRGQQ